MRIYIKVRFEAKTPKFEKVLGEKYILYLPFAQDSETEEFITKLLSKKLGVVQDKIYFAMVDKNGDWVFDIDY